MATGAAPITPPVAARPRLGLVASAIRPDQLPAGWLNGITFPPEAQAPTLDVDGYWWDSCLIDAEEGTVPDPATVEGGPGTKTAGDRPPIVRFLPWQVIEGDHCSPPGWRTGEVQARARRHLEAATPAKVEFEFWTGTVATLGNFPNLFLASTDADELNSGDAMPLPHALAALQDYLATTITGRGMIHATVATVSLWYSAGMIRREGNVWLDVVDNIIVPGNGYIGTGPDGSAAPANQAWAYATGMVQYLEAPNIEVLPGAESEALDRSVNTMTYRAERTVLPYWDGIAHGAALVDHCSTCCESATSA